MERNLKFFLDELSKRGWKIRLREKSVLHFADDISPRYPSIPQELIEFLSTVASCANHDETCWFLCEENYNGTSASAYHWNEIELESVKYATGDHELQEDIKAFWDNH